MIDVIVHCLRFRSKERGVVEALEGHRIELLIMQMAQRKSFVELFSKLEDNIRETVKLDLAKFLLSVDSDNIITLRGRFKETTISDDLQHTMLL